MLHCQTDLNSEQKTVPEEQHYSNKFYSPMASRVVGIQPTWISKAL